MGARSPGGAPQFERQFRLLCIPGLPSRPGPGPEQQHLPSCLQRVSRGQSPQPAVHDPQQAAGLIADVATGSLSVHAVTAEHLLQPRSAMACGSQAQQQIHVLGMAQRRIKATATFQQGAPEHPGTGKHGLVLESRLQSAVSPLQPGTDILQRLAVRIQALPATEKVFQPRVGVEAGRLAAKPAWQGDVVGVKKGHQRCPRRSPTGVAGRGHASAGQLDQPHRLGPAGGPARHQGRRCIPTSVIHGHQLPGLLLLPGQGRQASRQPVRGIAERNDNSDSWQHGAAWWLLVGIHGCSHNSDPPVGR